MVFYLTKIIIPKSHAHETKSFLIYTLVPMNMWLKYDYFSRILHNTLFVKISYSKNVPRYKK